MSLPPQASAPAGADPSMEDILASIRRILTEDEAAPAAAPAVEAHPQPPPAPPPPDEEDDGVLDLSTAMLVPEPVPEHVPEPVPEASGSFGPPALPGGATEAARPPLVAEPLDAASIDEMFEAPRHRPFADDDESLVAPEAAAAAATSVSHLVRRLSAERGSAVYRGGPTIEDVVREEMRPLLKAWLDANLPPLVERLVRAEIERVVARGMD